MSGLDLYKEMQSMFDKIEGGSDDIRWWIAFMLIVWAVPPVLVGVLVYTCTHGYCG